MIDFQTLKLSLAVTLFEPYSTQITISFKPHPFQAKFLHSPLKVCVSNIFFYHLFSDYAEFVLRVLKIGDFQKLGWVSIFVKKFSIL